MPGRRASAISNLAQRVGERLTSGVVFDRQQFPLRSGGHRTVVYFKGCPLRCLWCCNPESQSCEPDLMIRSDRCLDCGRCEGLCPRKAVLRAGPAKIVTDRALCRACGACADQCASGARTLRGKGMSAGDVLAELPSGVLVLSGGEPLLQAPFAAELLRLAKRSGFRTAVETCGHAPWLDVARVLPNADLLLFDLKHVDPLIHRRLTGVRNDLILANLERVAASGARVAVRMPLVPGCNADAETVLATARLVRSLGITDFHLLPYHRHGEWKYMALGRGYPMDGAVPLSDEVVNELRRLAEGVVGLRVRVGG